jgi:AcrR family transcriptional regulator
VTGRPRTVDDATILRATAEVIGRAGPAGLTLAAVAREVGLSAATLVQRFGSKRGLLLALAARAAGATTDLYVRAARRHSSPLAALRAAVTEAMAPMGTPDAFANHLAFLCLDLTDPQLHAHALASHDAQRRAVQALLEAAVAAGELRDGTDTARLARAVQAMTAGSGLMWALERGGTLAGRIGEGLATALGPHLKENT